MKKTASSASRSEYGFYEPENPEISTTQWRSVSDQKERVYYFKQTETPAIIWIDLKEFMLRPGAPVMKLDLIGNPDKVYEGNVIRDMKQSKGFIPMYQLTDEIARQFS